jgi:hypothetical protein
VLILPVDKKPGIVIDANNKIKLLIGDFNREKLNQLADKLMDKKTALIILGAGILTGILLALLL